MNLLEILKKIFSCAMPQAASEGDMDSISPSDKTNDTASADDAEVEEVVEEETEEAEEVVEEETTEEAEETVEETAEE